MTYDHKQQAPLHWLLHALATGMVVGAWGTYASSPLATAILALLASLFFLLGMMFAHLTVRDEGDSLAVRFGPLRLFGTQVQYGEISSVQPSRSALIDGWSIHWIPGRGWTFNLWGFDCVELVVKGRMLRIGSDDVANLVKFLQSRLSSDDE